VDTGLTRGSTVGGTFGTAVSAAVVDALGAAGAAIGRTFGTTVGATVMDSGLTRSTAVRGTFRTAVGTAIVDTGLTRSTAVRGTFGSTVSTAVVDTGLACGAAVGRALVLVGIEVGLCHDSSLMSLALGGTRVMSRVVCGSASSPVERAAMLTGYL